MNGDLFPEVQTSPDEVPDERYTTRATLDLCRRLARVEAFDLDAAACLEVHHAARYYSAATNGLRWKWSCPEATPAVHTTPFRRLWWPEPTPGRARVWCNPPYSSIAPWVEKAWVEAAQCEVIAMLLPAWTDRQWWAEHVEPYRDGRVAPDFVRLTTHFLPGRVAFGQPGNPEGIGCGSPPFWCVLLVWRRA